MAQEYGEYRIRELSMHQFHQEKHVRGFPLYISTKEKQFSGVFRHRIPLGPCWVGLQTIMKPTCQPKQPAAEISNHPERNGWSYWRSIFTLKWQKCWYVSVSLSSYAVESMKKETGEDERTLIRKNNCSVLRSLHHTSHLSKEEVMWKSNRKQNKIKILLKALRNVQSQYEKVYT